jgi:hypothetical protein
MTTQASTMSAAAAAAAISSKSGSLKYIQPHYKLAECITSHRISYQSFMDLMNHYHPSEHRVVTTYYDTDIFYSDVYYCSSKIRSVSCQIKYHQETLAFENIEYVGENAFDLSVTRFSPSLNYHHERQGIQLIKDTGSYTMTLEILIPNITNPADINPTNIIEQIRDSTNIISLSYHFTIKSMASRELTTHITTLMSLTHPVELTDAYAAQALA